MRVRARVALAAAVAVVMASLGAGQAGAAYPQGLLPNWPALLPPNPNNSSGRVLLAYDVCPSGDLACAQATVDEMVARWRPLHRVCDHRAVFALTYLRTTQEYFRTVRRTPELFSDVPWLEHEDAIFAELYFRAYDRYVAGQPVPAAWRIAFDSAATSRVTALGDLLLGMNAHINRDLPYALAHVGLVKPDGSSRKPDHDQVNLFLDRVIDPLQRELANKYDPSFSLVDAEPSPVDEVTALQLIRGFRENAWRNAQRLVNARTAAKRLQVRQSIELQSTLGALTILATNTVPGYGQMRDAYCQSR